MHRGKISKIFINQRKGRIMEKILRKGFISLLSLLMVFTTFNQLITNVAAEQEYENIALDKVVVASSAIAGNEGSNAVDGKMDTKWEVGNISTNPSIIVDLGKEESFEKITLKWASNFAFRYKLYVAKTDQKYGQVLFHEEGTGGDEEWEMEENTIARYVKIELIEAKSGESTIGLKELEVLRVKKDTSNDPVNIALNKPAYASGNEANLDRLGPGGAFDGKYSNDYNERWSSGNITKSPQWIYVDLEAEMTFSSIHIFWENAFATKYVLQYSNDVGTDKNWITFVNVDDGKGSWEKFDFDPITARFVRLYATASNGVGSAKPISIWEMEIYEEVNNSLTVDDIAKDLTQYTQYVMDLVYNKYGKTPMAWASMGCVDSDKTKIPDYPIMDAWANYAISLKSLFNQDYKLINATNKYGYIVPGGNNGYPDFAKEEEMYNNLSAGKFRDKMGAGVDVAEGHPKIVGGSISLWNDRGIFNGISVYDVFARIQSILPIYAQTFWYGKDNDKSYDQFKAEVNTLGTGPNVEMDKEISSKTEKVYDFDMENTSKQGDNLVIKDNSGNGYDATAIKATVETTDEGRALKLNGDGYLQMQHSALKWPYTLAFDLKIDESQTGDIVLFEETMPIEECNQWIDTKYQTRKIYLKEIDGKYKLMYDRDSYHYEHNIELEKGKLYQLAFTSDKKYTNAYLDGVVKSTINGPILTNSGNKWYDSASINLPLQKIGQNLVGTLDNIKVYNRLLNNEEIKNLYDTGIDVIHENVALNKKATASSSYTDYQTPNKAFDGIINQSASGPEQSRWASARTHDQWIQVDLNKVYKVDQIKITWEDAYGVDYELKGSVNGKDWFTIKNVTGNVAKENNHTGLGDIEARYIKLIGTKAANNAKYGYSIYEIEVYENPKNDLLRTISQVKDKLSEMNVGNFHGQIKEEAYQTFTAYLTNLENEVVGKESISEEEMLKFKEELSKKYTNLKKQVVRVDKGALETVLEVAESKLAEGYSEANSTVSSWQSFIQNKEAAEAMADRMDITQSDVDKMVSELQTALDNLTFRALESSFNELVALIDEVTKMETDYSAEMFKVMKGYLDQANALVALGAGEVVEKDVQANLTNLANEKAILISYRELKVSVEVAKEILDKEAVNLRPATLKVLQDAYEAGRKLIDDNSKELIVLQNAKQEINEAIEGLLEIVERKDLDKLIEQVKDLKEEDYTEESWKTFKNGYERAVTVNQDLDANEGAIQNAYDELLRAFNELKQVVNKDNLLLQIELAKQVLANKDKYDIELVKELEELLSQAVALIDNDVSSEDVNKMSDALLTKIEAVKASQKEEPKVEEQPGTEVSDKTKKNAKTGDETMLFEFAMISLVALLAVVRLRKKS